MGMDRHAFALGETLVVVASGGLFKGLGKWVSVDEVPQLHVVRLTVVEETVVAGQYRPAERHFGYRAIGSDGWHYQCNAKSFDDAAMNPYQNWQREYTEGVHYESAGGKIERWLIPESEFRGRYKTWDVLTAIALMDEQAQQALAGMIRSDFNDCEIAQCDKVSPAQGDVPGAKHKELGWHYVKHGCEMCRWDAQDAAKKAKDASTSEA